MTHGGENAEASRPQGRDNAPGVRALPTQTFARIAILSTLLLLAVYTAFAVARIQREPQVTTAANSALPSRAGEERGRVREVARRSPGRSS